MERRCKGCRKPFSPVEVLMGPLCGQCVREEHRIVLGELTREQVQRKRQTRMGRYDGGK